MRKDEFVELHGDEVWERCVKPKQNRPDVVVSTNANILVHADINKVLVLLGQDPELGLLGAEPDVRTCVERHLRVG